VEILQLHPLKSSLNGSTLKTATFLHRLPCRTDFVAQIVFLITSRDVPHRQQCSFSYANRYRVDVFIKPFPSSDCLFLLIMNPLRSNGHRCVVCFGAVAWKRMCFQNHSLATAISLDSQFLLWANKPKYRNQTRYVRVYGVWTSQTWVAHVFTLFIKIITVSLYEIKVLRQVRKKYFRASNRTVDEKYNIS
jgi:hypothetical protein